MIARGTLVDVRIGGAWSEGWIYVRPSSNAFFMLCEKDGAREPALAENVRATGWRKRSRLLASMHVATALRFEASALARPRPMQDAALVRSLCADDYHIARDAWACALDCVLDAFGERPDGPSVGSP